MRIELRVLKKTLSIKQMPVRQFGGRHASQHGAPVGPPKLARQLQDKIKLAG